MKGLSNKQIDFIRCLKVWSVVHKRTETFGIDANDVKDIISKKIKRDFIKNNYNYITNSEKIRKLIKEFKLKINTNYFKILIEGESGIYLASPVHKHKDYNKCRIFDKNKNTLKLMNIYNSYFKIQSIK